MNATQPPRTANRVRPNRPVSLALEAEIMTDADTGRPELVVTTGEQQYEPATADELRGHIASARDRLLALEAMADQFEALTSAEEELRALAAGLGAELIEDTPELPLPHSIFCWIGSVDGRLILAVRAGQDTTFLLRTVRELVAIRERKA